jgi:hypothetical protein
VFPKGKTVPRRKHSGSGSTLLTRVNRMGTIALVSNVGLCLILCAIVERTVISAVDQRGAAAASPGQAAESPDDPVSESPRGPRQTRSPVRLFALESTVKQLTLAQRGTLARRSFGTATTGRPIVQQTRTTKTWALGTAAIPPPKGSPAMPDVALFVARAVGRRWQVGLGGSSAFNRLLAAAPAALVPSAERALLARYSVAASPTNSTGLMLPWKQGQPWALVADKYGLGFTGGDGRVLAAGDGRLYRFCGTSPGHGLILLIHPNGLATEYYQLTSQPRLAGGDIVRRGDYLGRVGTDRPCGGGSPEPQVRFGLRHADQDVTLDGKNVGGWTFLNGTDLDRYVAVRGDKQILPGEQVTNLGVIGVPGLPGLPGLSGNSGNSGSSNGSSGSGGSGGTQDPSSAPPADLPSPEKADQPGKAE